MYYILHYIYTFYGPEMSQGVYPLPASTTGTVNFDFILSQCSPSKKKSSFTTNSFTINLIMLLLSLKSCTTFSFLSHVQGLQSPSLSL